MPSRNILVLAIAVFLGLIAVYLANSYFSVRQTQQEHFAQQNRMARIVVASQDLAFGLPVTAQNVRMTNWPADSVPVGAFTSIQEATRNRAALRPIVVGEPILASKVSGVDGRATVSANLPQGKLAYSVPINDMTGVGGFVRPGDSVDVLLTRQIPGNGATGNDKMTDVLLEAVHVIGIDQTSDESKTEPAVGKTATLEVDTLGAQKLALATQTGTLSLALRNVGDPVTGNRSTVTSRDLGAGRYYIAERNPGGLSGAVQNAMRGAASMLHPASPAVRPGAGRNMLSTPRSSGPSMTVVRGVKQTEYEVKRGY